MEMEGNIVVKVNKKTKIHVYFSLIPADTKIVVCVLRKRGKTMGVGLANLNPHDKYDMETGRKLALGRAVDDAAKKLTADPKEQRNLTRDFGQRLAKTGRFLTEIKA